MPAYITSPFKPSPVLIVAGSAEYLLGGLNDKTDQRSVLYRATAQSPPPLHWCLSLLQVTYLQLAHSSQLLVARIAPTTTLLT